VFSLADARVEARTILDLTRPRAHDESHEWPFTGGSPPCILEACETRATVLGAMHALHPALYLGFAFLRGRWRDPSLFHGSYRSCTVSCTSRGNLFRTRRFLAADGCAVKRLAQCSRAETSAGIPHTEY